MKDNSIKILSIATIILIVTALFHIYTMSEHFSTDMNKLILSSMILYRGPNFSTELIQIPSLIGGITLPQKPVTHIIQSYKLGVGYKVTLYDNINYTGKSVSSISSVTDLTRIALGPVASMKIERVNNPLSVNFYAQPNYVGNYVRVPIGNYSFQNNDTVIELSNNSIILDRGVEMILYDAPNYKGNYIKIRDKIPSTKNLEIKTVKSLIIKTSQTYSRRTFSYQSAKDYLQAKTFTTAEQPPPPTNVNAVHFFYQTDYKGKYISVNIGAYVNTTQIKMSDMNLRSIKIPQHLVIIFYEEGWDGKKVILTNDVSDFSSIKLNHITFFEVKLKGVRMYNDCYFKGTSLPLAEGDFDIEYLRQKGFDNNTIKSVEISGNYNVQLYNNSAFVKELISSSNDVFCIPDIYKNQSIYNDNISSIRIRKT